MSREPGDPGTLVLGLGNPLMGDDGFGAAVVDALRAPGLPDGVDAEAAPDLLRLESLWRGQHRVWLVDAVAGGAEPGAIYRFGHDELAALSPRAGAAHDLDLVLCLRWLLVARPDLAEARFRLWGSEPRSLSPGAGLSPPVRAAVETVAAEVRVEATA